MTNNIKRAREKTKMTQKECADCLGITLRAWQGYEQGSREPKFELLIKIADLFNVTTDYLLGRETIEPNAINQIAYEYNMDACEKKIINNYLSLPKDMRIDFIDFLRKAFREVQEEATQAADELSASKEDKTPDYEKYSKKELYEMYQRESDLREKEEAEKYAALQ